MDIEKMKELLDKYLWIITPEHEKQYGATLFTDLQILDKVNVDSNDKRLHRIEYVIDNHKYTVFVDPVTNTVIGKIIETPS